LRLASTEEEIEYETGLISVFRNFVAFLVQPHDSKSSHLAWLGKDCMRLDACMNLHQGSSKSIRDTSHEQLAAEATKETKRVHFKAKGSIHVVLS
jgi:hypothetical protein